jgi:oxygen-independent coproporphyrinogen-3 oxidase
MTGFSVYWHWPFCRSRCRYCDFVVNIASSPVLRAAYGEALLAEWRQERLPPGPVVSVYVGGGTPSLADPSAIAGLLEAVARRATVAADVEVTLEANPGTVTGPAFREWAAIGVNRLSLGVQALQDHLLRAMNRGHTAAEAEAAFREARAAGFSNINVDAIYGLPDQSLADWQATVDTVLAWGPEHVSLYQLQVEPRTWLGRRVASGRLALPDPDLVADMADWAADRLNSRGWRRYEVSNFARLGFESRHNLGYWQQRPYLGIGVGAHSFNGAARWWNDASVPRYIEAVAAGRDPEVGRERLGAADLRSEFFWLGLRQVEGVSRSVFRQRYGVSVEAAFPGVLDRLTGWGVLATDGDRIRLTPRGMEVANRVLAEFLPPPPAFLDSQIAPDVG